MSDYLAILVWLGGAIGAVDAGRGFWWAVFWTYHVTRMIVMRPAPPAAMKDGG